MPRRCSGFEARCKLIKGVDHFDKGSRKRLTQFGYYGSYAKGYSEGQVLLDCGLLESLVLNKYVYKWGIVNNAITITIKYSYYQ